MQENSIRALQLVGFRPEHCRYGYAKEYEPLENRLLGVATAVQDKKPSSALLAGSLGAGKSVMLALLCEAIYKTALMDVLKSPDNKGLGGLGDVFPYYFAKKVRYCTHTELATIWEHEFDSNLDLPDEKMFKEAKILFLDDMGGAPENMSGRNIAKFEEFIDWRWSNGLKTFIATNLSPDEIVRPKFAQWHRIARRVLDRDWMLQVILTHEFKKKGKR